MSAANQERGAATSRHSVGLFERPLGLVIGAVGVAALLASCSSDGAVASITETTPTPAQSTTSIQAAPSTVATTAAPADVTIVSTTTSSVPEVVGLFPLTGIPTTDEQALFRPAIAAKIDNVEAARPQAGLVQADLVYEEIVEGGLTRLLAIFHSNGAETIGPIRSARSTDVPLLTPLREPLFAWSGANKAFAALIRSVAIRDVGLDAQPDAYERAAGRSAPSDLMTSTNTLYSLVTLGQNLTPNAVIEHLMPGQRLKEGEAVAGVTIDYGATEVSHTWDASLGGWVRLQNRTAHVDSLGEPIAPENVIVQFVTYADSGLVDSAGAVVPVADLEGSGAAWFLLKGQVIHGSWNKANLTAAAQYLDSTGEAMKFAPGRTWVLLVREGTAELR